MGIRKSSDQAPFTRARWLAAGAAVALLAGVSLTAAGQTSRPASAPASQPAGGAESEFKKETIPVKPKTAPEHIVVQHILIAFDGSLPGRQVGRDKDEAKKLAYEILKMARKGADFDTLVKQWTNDAFPGVYAMSNLKVPPGKNEYARDRMVPAFGNVGFELSPGNIGIADYDPKTSPFGWHIIKRVK